MQQEMTSSQPYLIRAIYEWIVDNGLTPYIMVNTERNDVEVPGQYIQDGKIILNLAPHAIRHLNMDNDWISFSARFSGKSFNVMFPVQATMAIYAAENQQGMVFETQPQTAAAPVDTFEDDELEPQQPPRPPRGKPVLRRVK
jgi:stringent starvation protein B